LCLGYYWFTIENLCYDSYHVSIHTGTQVTPSSNLQLKKLRCCCICFLRKFCWCHISCDNLRWAVVNFINILRTNFLYECCFGSFFYVHVTRKKLQKQRSCKKFVRKMLVTLTPERLHFANSCRHVPVLIYKCKSFLSLL